MIMEQELPLLVVATRNAHKTGEIRAMLAGKWEVKDLSDYPQAPPVDETGVTFTENATLKALINDSTTYLRLKPPTGKLARPAAAK